MRKASIIVCVVGLLLLALAAPGNTAQFRAFWVDAWHSGFENSTATQSMVNYAVACHANAIFVEVRKRGDAYYVSSYEPKGTGVTPTSGYDCLADICTKAHAAGLQVHAWVVVSRVWTDTVAPPVTTPNHVFNAHPEWFSLTNAGAKFDSVNDSFLDPGVPDVENYTNDVVMQIVNNYPIDGLILDYIRYPGTTWGYNPTAVSRYNAEYGLSGSPSYTSTQWSNWRRQQVTNIVKRTYLEAKALKPQLKVGASVWNTAGTGNSSYFQNWDSWMSSHILDYCAPMNYTTTNSTFNSYCNDSKNRMYGRHIYMSQASYLNTISNSMTQLNSAVTYGFQGISPYSYAVTNSGTVDQAGFKNSLIAGPFAGTQAVPTMSWITSPTYGMLKGFITNGSGTAVYPAAVSITGKSTPDSGTGFYGFVDVPTGSCTVTVTATGYQTATASTWISAGAVADLDITMVPTGGGGSEIIIDNPSAAFTGSWTTGTSSTDKYGSDYAYANTATSDTATAIWRPNIGTAGNYDIYVWYPQGANRSTAAPYTVYYNGGSITSNVNQTTGGGQWVLIASGKSFLAGTAGYVKLGNGTGEASKVVMADAVKFVLASGGDTQPPAISSVASSPADTTCTVTWTTDEAATSQVDYGPTTSYGSTTTLDSTLVTSHSVGLSGLTAGTLYHYRVRSKDAANNETISGDYTFTTTGTVPDIIIDNPAATFTGSWSLGTSSADKYGSDYNFANTATSETATAVWRPNITTAGNYSVYVWYPQGANRSAMAPFTVYWNGGSQTISVNQQANGGMWNLLVSAKSFATGTGGYVKLGNGTGESAVVMADAIKFVKVP